MIVINNDVKGNVSMDNKPQQEVAMDNKAEEKDSEYVGVSSPSI